MKITGRADAFVARPDPALAAILIYGPDAGLVRERLNALTKAVAGTLDDPFRVSEFNADALRDDPARLGDEAAALAFTGGRRVVRIRGASDTIADTLGAFVEDPVGGALVLVAADDLSPRSKLRLAFEKADRAAALPCYADSAQSLEAVIRETLKTAGMSITGDALSWLTDRLGGDRELSRRELEKLVLYMGNERTITEDDAMACIGDTAAMSLDDLIFAVGDGDQATVQRVFGRLTSEGTSAISILTSVARHVLRLHETRGRVAEGKPLESALMSLRPPVFFKYKARFAAQANRWSEALLARALELLNEAEMTAKSTDMPADAVIERALIQIANVARNTQRR
jgi:DNA polymerase-3 subunit delta